MPRPKEFDPDTKLHEAMELFWRVGFERTSIPLLEERLGINRFSIYSTFGKKRDLFLQALDLYAEGVGRRVVLPLEVGTEGLEDLHRFVEAWKGIFVDDEIRGCLLCNTATELGGSDVEIANRVRAYFARLESAVLQTLLRARRRGEVQGDEEALGVRATSVRLAIQGALVAFASAPSSAEAARTVDAVEAVVMGSWSSPPPSRDSSATR